MAYHIHTTDGIIIARNPVGEASWICWVLTRDMGLIYARSQGTREIASKLRSHVQLFTHGSFSFVRGKYGWRMTNAHKYHNLTSCSVDVVETFARISALTKILVAGEESNETLYSVVEQGYIYACTYPLDRKGLGAFERIVVLRILYQLGYLGASALADQYSRGSVLTADHLDESQHHVHEMTRIINASLRATQF